MVMPSVVLYDLSFDESRNALALGQLPFGSTDYPNVVGQPPFGPTGYFARAPVVQAPFGPFTTQSLEFQLNSKGDTQGILFDIEAGASAYRLSFDFYYPYSNSHFGQFWAEMDGMSGFRGIHLFNDGRMSSIGGNATGWASRDIGVFPDSLITHFTLDANLAEKSWSVAMNGQTIFTEGFDVGKDLLQIRMFYLAQGGAIFNTKVAVDNLRIEAIPEPSALSLSLLMGALIVLRWALAKRRGWSKRSLGSHNG
jgi:hypothetical protein